MQIIKADQLQNQVFMAIDENGYLPVNKKISLEYLSCDMDGIFPTWRSWETFVRKNFLDTGYHKNEFISIKESTVKRWCYPEKEYISKFVQPIGGGDYVLIDPENIELSFDYEWYSGKNAKPNFACTGIEIFVTAKIKGA